MGEWLHARAIGWARWWAPYSHPSSSTEIGIFNRNRNKWPLASYVTFIIDIVTGKQRHQITTSAIDAGDEFCGWSKAGKFWHDYDCYSTLSIILNNASRFRFP